MTWNYYNDKEIKKSETYSMVMSVSVKIEREEKPIDLQEVGLTERRLHGIVEDILRQELKGKTYSGEHQDDDGEEYTVIVDIKRVDENR